MRSAWASVLVGCGIVATGSFSFAQQTPVAPLRLPERQVLVTRDPITREILVGFNFRHVVDSEVQRKLQSGLSTVIVVAAAVFSVSNNDSPVAGAGVWQSCRVTFDVWNEVYRLQITRLDGVRNVVAVNLEGVLRRCTEVRDFPLTLSVRTPGRAAPRGSSSPSAAAAASAHDYPSTHSILVAGAKYFLAATAEVNPVSQETLEQIRRWVSSPPGSSPASPGDSLFGSFVGLFVARIGKADHTVSFRTPVFVVPPVAGT